MADQCWNTDQDPCVSGGGDAHSGQGFGRRQFLRLLASGVAAQAIPFKRVWSFPSKIVIPYRTYTVGRYAYFGDLTAIDQTVAELSSQLSYRLALSLSALVKATAE